MYANTMEEDYSIQSIASSSSSSSGTSSSAEVIRDFGSATEPGNGDDDQFARYLGAVATNDIIMPSNNSGMIPYHDSPGSNSINLLQLVFQSILDSSTSIINSETSSSYSTSVTSYYGSELQVGNHTAYGELSTEQVNRLHNIVERLDSAGCPGNCNEVYKVSRKSAVEARLLRFDTEKLTVNYLKGLDREEYTRSIRLWILAVYNCYLNIIPGEEQYFQKIFDGIGAVTFENCFLAIVKHVAVELLDSVEAITAATTSFQKLFDILDVYEAMLVVLPKIEATFQSSQSLDIYSRATKNIHRLIILARKLFLSFEDTVLNEQSNTPLAKGKIHSMTRYAMDYVSRILLYKESLKDILVSVPTKGLGNLDEEKFLEVQGRTPLEQHMTWIIISLKINLAGKSCHYGDPSLRYAFILYNVNYIVQVINESPKLRVIIGKEHMSKLDKDVAEAEQNYVSSTWDKVLCCLGDDGLNQWLTFYSGVSRNALKQKLKKFNKVFEEVCETQCTELVANTQIRGQILQLILRKLIPAYKSFLDKLTGSERYNHMYIKYSPQDLENKVQNLFLEH